MDLNVKGSITIESLCQRSVDRNTSPYDIDSCSDWRSDEEECHDFISQENTFHNIVEMLKKLEEEQNALKRKQPHKQGQMLSRYDQIWYSDLESWKHRTQYRINALRILVGDNRIACKSSFYNRVVYIPNDRETNEILQSINSKFESMKQKNWKKLVHDNK